MTLYSNTLFTELGLEVPVSHSRSQGTLIYNTYRTYNFVSVL